MKTLAVVLVLISVAGLFVYTNPSMNDYEQFVHQSLLKETRGKNPNSPANLIAPFLSGLVGGYVSSQTIRKDYVFFSFYDAHIGKERLKILGVLNNFIVLKTVKQDPRP